MKRFLLLIVIAAMTIGVLAQAPQKFNYQAVARDASGVLLKNSNLTIRIGIQQNTTTVWQEDHDVVTNEFGLFTLEIGGSLAENGSGSVGSFEDIDWGAGVYEINIQVNDGSGFQDLGDKELLSVPYALYAASGVDDADPDPSNEIQTLTYNSALLELSNSGGSADLSDLINDLDADPENEFQDLMFSLGRISLSDDPTTTSIDIDNRIEDISGWGLYEDTILTTRPVAIVTKEAQTEEPLFEVRNDLGNPVFAVFNDGVMIYVDEDKKGVKGGFAVGGYNAKTKGITQEYLRVTPDSVRVYVPELPYDEQKMGGFAVGGYDTKTNEVIANYMEVTKSNTNIYFDTVETKGVKGGFAVGGYNAPGKAGVNQLMSLTPENYLIGENAGMSLTTGLYNSFLGYEAGTENTTGSNNVFIGRKSGVKNLGADENTFVGNESGYNTIDGHGNVYIGNQSGFDNRAGYFNTFAGYQSGYANTSHYNSIFGYQAGFNKTEGKSNTFMGHQAGYGYPLGGPGNTGANNVFVGKSSGFSNTSGSSNVFMGNGAGYSNQIGENNVFMGTSAGGSNIGGSSNVFMGNTSGNNNTSGENNVFIGRAAGYANTSGVANVFIGDAAGYSNTLGSYNTILGYQAGYSLTGGLNYWEGAYNTIIGYEAGKAIKKGFKNILIGYRAGYSIRDNRYNIIIGEQAGTNLEGVLGEELIGQSNILMGYRTGVGLTTGSSNIMLGLNSGTDCSIDAEDNVWIGVASGRSSASSRSVFIGESAGYGEDADDKLVIQTGYTGSDNANNALIYGDFFSKYLIVNGRFTTSTNSSYNYAATFKNDGNLESRYGVRVQAGTDDATGTNYMFDIYDGDGSYQGGLLLIDGSVFLAGTSDIRLKKDIVNTSINAVSLLENLRVVDFSYIKNPGVRHTGYIAQEVKEEFPEMVNYNEMEDVYTTSPSTLIPVLHKAIQEQQAQIEMLEKRIAKLEAK